MLRDKYLSSSLLKSGIHWNTYYWL